jgi:hypothetical protein
VGPNQWGGTLRTASFYVKAILSTEDAPAAVEQAVLLTRLPCGVESAEPEGVMLQQENQTLAQNFEWVCQARSRAMTSLPLPYKSAISA